MEPLERRNTYILVQHSKQKLIFRITLMFDYITYISKSIFIVVWIIKKKKR